MIDISLKLKQIQMVEHSLSVYSLYIVIFCVVVCFYCKLQDLSFPNYLFSYFYRVQSYAKLS